MKNNLEALAIFFGLFLIAVAIYLKPVSQRYAFEKFDDPKLVEYGYVVKDTQTGKVHKWVNQVLEGKGVRTFSNTIDPINQKAVKSWE